MTNLGRYLKVRNHITKYDNKMELTFEKWEDGRWFVVLPDYDGDQEDLEMVDGADKLLDVLNKV